jgi:hypothetical protein
MSNRVHLQKSPATTNRSPPPRFLRRRVRTMILAPRYDHGKARRIVPAGLVLRASPDQPMRCSRRSCRCTLGGLRIPATTAAPNTLNSPRCTAWRGQDAHPGAAGDSRPRCHVRAWAARRSRDAARRPNHDHFRLHDVDSSPPPASGTEKACGRHREPDERLHQQDEEPGLYRAEPAGDRLSVPAGHHGHHCGQTGGFKRREPSPRLAGFLEALSGLLSLVEYGLAVCLATTAGAFLRGQIAEGGRLSGQLQYPPVCIDIDCLAMLLREQLAAGRIEIGIRGGPEATARPLPAARSVRRVRWDRSSRQA